MNASEAYSGLPETWELTTLGEVADVVGGSTPKSKEPSYWEGDVPWLAVSDLTGHTDKFISHGVRSITRAGFESCPTQMLPAGSVVFSSRAPIGYVAITTQELCTSQGFKSFVPSETLSADYLYWYLRSAVPIARSLASGTTFPELSGRAAGKIPIPVPPRAEQGRIVEAIEEILSQVASSEGSFAKAQSLLASFRLALLNGAFLGRLVTVDQPDKGLGDLLDNAGVRTVSGSQALPRHWERVRLHDVADHRLGKMLDKSKNRGQPRPYLRNLNVQWGSFDKTDVKEMRITESERERYGVLRGDLLVCEGGEPGRCAVWDSDEPIYFQKALHRVRTGEFLQTEFLEYYLRYAAGSNLLSEHLTGSTIKHLPGEKLAQIAIPLPPISEQRVISSAIRTQLDRAGHLDEELAARGTDATNLRRSVFRRAFSGGLVSGANA